MSPCTGRRTRRSAVVAGLHLLSCWIARALGGALLLSALGFHFSPPTALCVLCLSAAAGVVPITAGGLAASVGATAAILLTLGVGKNIAINFSLASGCCSPAAPASPRSAAPPSRSSPCLGASTEGATACRRCLIEPSGRRDRS